MKKNQVIDLVKKNPIELKNFKDFQNDVEVVLAAVKTNIFAIEHANSKIIKNEKIIEALVDHKDWNLKYFSCYPNIIGNKKIVLNSIKKDFNAFKYMRKSLMLDTEFIEECIKVQPKVSIFI